MHLTDLTENTLFGAFSSDWSIFLAQVLRYPIHGHTVCYIMSLSIGFEGINILPYAEIRIIYCLHMKTCQIPQEKFIWILSNASFLVEMTCILSVLIP